MARDKMAGELLGRQFSHFSVDMEFSSEIITLCDGKKWNPSRRLQARAIDGTRILV
jgi:hypothetical protein